MKKRTTKAENATIAFKPSKINPLRSVAQISFSKRPLPDVWGKLEYWGFSASRNKCQFEAKLKDLHERSIGAWTIFLKSWGYAINAGIGAAYIPSSDTGELLITIIPDTMADNAHIAIRKLEKRYMNGDIAEYVRKKLNVPTKAELAQMLGAEQIDAVGLAICNIENKDTGIIIGDQTGIGKGRVAAGLVRYAHVNNILPVFVTEKPNLFSDFYRDMKDLKIGHLVPFIINNQEKKTNIVEFDRETEKERIVYKSTSTPQIINSEQLPSGYDMVMTTYSQFGKASPKYAFMRSIARDAILIMDESHNASGGESKTGEFFRGIIPNAKGCMFLSATFAKRPENLSTYALKTCLKETGLDNEDLAHAMKTGGVALQEVVSTQLVAEGEMVRRQRTYDGIETTYPVLEQYASEHSKTADEVTAIIRAIINFQRLYVSAAIDEMEEEAVEDGEEVEGRKGTDDAGIDNQPFFSRVFNIINQLLLSIKADAIADEAILQIKAGRKPMLALANTMEACFADLGVEETVSARFGVVCERGLRSTLKITRKGATGKSKAEYIPVERLSRKGQAEYARILEMCRNLKTDINVSPIDWIIKRINDAGYSAEEVTGRKLMFKFINKTQGQVVPRKNRLTATEAFNRYNNNLLDCLIINQSGSTGVSGHAIVTDMVPRHMVKQRIMLVLQPELNINTEVQKRGRINRTGQVLLPVYKYPSTVIPAELRLQMMLQRKLKSLDANTTSDQKTNLNAVTNDGVVDWLNKYGDILVFQKLEENYELDEMLDFPLWDKKKKRNVIKEDGSSKVAGRVAVLSIKEQEEFYDSMAAAYIEYVEDLKQRDEYDLEVEALEYDAVLEEEEIFASGNGGKTIFGKDAKLGVYDIENLKRPMPRNFVTEQIKNYLNGDSPKEYMRKINSEIETYYNERLKVEIEKIKGRTLAAIDSIVIEKEYLKIKEENKQAEYIESRTIALKEEQENSIERTKTKFDNTINFLYHKLKLFYPGRGIIENSEPDNDDNGHGKWYGVFLGVSINPKEKNPYAPSNIRLKFAMCDSRGVLSLSLSGKPLTQIESIIANSIDMNMSTQLHVLEHWDKLIEESDTQRTKRKIITGNVLMAMGRVNSGRLIAFTMRGGGKEVGILMPLSTEGGDITNVQVPIHKCKKLIQSMTRDAQLSISYGGYIARKMGWQNEFCLVFPAGKKTNHITTDLNLIKTLKSKDGFVKKSGNMNGSIDPENIHEAIEALASLRVNVILSRAIYNNYFADDELEITTNSFSEDEVVARGKLKADEELYNKRLAAQDKTKRKSNDNQDSALIVALAMQLKMRMVKARLRLMQNKK